MEKPFENNDKTFLADWLEGKLSDQQLKQRVSESDFEAYVKLRLALENSAISTPDLEASYAAIKAKKIAALRHKPVRTVRMYGYVAVAATLILLFGLSQLFIFTNSALAGFGKTMAVRMDDGSQITLNARSKISYPSLFRYNRTLKLDGEAYFEVEKGRTFTVETDQGKVEVLGTKFDVIARKGFFEVTCFEGKVKVSNGSRSVLLTQGSAVRFFGKLPESWKESNPLPFWTGDESGFRGTPLEYVIISLENQYHCEISYPKQLAHAKFTGSFTHSDIDTALQSVCLPLNLKYAKTASGKIILSE